MEAHRKYFAGSIKSVDSATRTITGHAYPPQLDRDSETILPSAFTEKGLQAFRKKAGLIWAHDYKGIPLGSVTSISNTSEGPKFEARFFGADISEQADRIWKIYEYCHENKLPVPLGVSVGFIPKASTNDKQFPDQRGRTYTDVEIIELSIVPVESNPGALATAKAKGLDTAFLEKAIKDISERGNALLTGITAIVQAIADGKGDPIEYASQAINSLMELPYINSYTDNGVDTTSNLDRIESGLCYESIAHLNYIIGGEGDPTEHAGEALTLLGQLQASQSQEPQTASGDSHVVAKATWTATYVNNLPDSAFLYVETGGTKEDHP